MKRSLKLSLFCLLALAPGVSFAEEETTTTTVITPRFRTVEIHPTVSILSFTELTLQKNGHTFSYDNTMRGVPLIGINLSTPFGGIGDFDMFGIFRLGYGTKFAEVDMDSGAGTQGIRLHSIPMTALFKARYHIKEVPSIQPALVVGVGSQFFHQSSRDADYTQSYFIPSLITGVSIGLFDPGVSATDWFGGFNFGINYQHGFSTENRLRAFSFDLGVVVIL